MRSPLNGPLEVGVRVLVVLTEAYPKDMDLNRLVLFDHGVLHSADLGGPESLHPPLRVRSGELGIKRSVIEQGLQVMLRAGLIEMEAKPDGIRFRASETAYSFVSILDARYVRSLRNVARWAVAYFDNMTEEAFRQHMRSVLGSWSEEFDLFEGSGSGSGAS